MNICDNCANDDCDLSFLGQDVEHCDDFTPLPPVEEDAEL